MPGRERRQRWNGRIGKLTIEGDIPTLKHDLWLVRDPGRIERLGRRVRRDPPSWCDGAVAAVAVVLRQLVQHRERADRERIPSVCRILHRLYEVELWVSGDHS